MTRTRALRIIEILCWTGGLLLSGFFVSQLAVGEAERLNDIEAFQLAYNEQPDQANWSPSRIAAWETSRAKKSDDVLAVLSIPSVELEVPVYQGASDFNMDRGAGIIDGTASPDQTGNVGISGHRDGYFRALKDVQAGDSLLLQTPSGEKRYTIRETFIVDPVDVEVLDPTEQSTVTLVTCYPFYFVGSAPQRFIVRAEIDNHHVNQ